jgi:hypothetical protein
VISLNVSGDIFQVLELAAAHITGIQIGAVHFALVINEDVIHFSLKITLWKVAIEWAKGNAPVLESVA